MQTMSMTMTKSRGLFRKENLPLLGAVAFLAFVVLAGPAFAGTDTTFDTAFTKFTAFLEGSGGKIITIISLALGLVGMASGRFSLGQIALPVGVGIGVGTGVPIVTSTVTALI
ncbi:MAG TPA: TrbC/VirB2 family protein [Sphingopyxis sp.]|nr:TrbC/VirB2 family protein [Sphingopyxis sp.]